MGRRPIREEKGDARKPVSPKPCRKSRSPGWAQAQAGNSPLRSPPLRHRRAASFSLKLAAAPVNFPAMANLHNANNKLIIGHRINNPVLALAYAIFVLSGQFFTAWRSRVIGEILNTANNAETFFFRYCFDFPGS